MTMAVAAVAISAKLAPTPPRFSMEDETDFTGPTETVMYNDSFAKWQAIRDNHMRSMGWEVNENGRRRYT